MIDGSGEQLVSLFLVLLQTSYGKEKKKKGVGERMV
jgi:hypothetical protein